jgi:hypothetical protein
MFKSQPTLHFILLKSMERLVDRYLRDEALALVPLHPNQQGYQAGKSVETALLQLMVRVEKVLDQQETALGVCLDIGGAFNSTSYDSMCDALVRHGVDHTIVLWIRATLEGCMAAATLSGSSMRIAVSRGYQQVCCGRFCGALFLMLLIARLNWGGIHVQGYTMTFVFLWWENSQTWCQSSCNGPF